MGKDYYCDGVREGTEGEQDGYRGRGEYEWIYVGQSLGVQRYRYRIDRGTVEDVDVTVLSTRAPRVDL